MKPELDQLTMDLPLDAKENVHQLIYSVLNTKLDDRTSQVRLTIDVECRS
jgi:hypothetical protein